MEACVSRPSSSFNVAAIAEVLNGEVHGDSSLELDGIIPLDLASRSDLSFFAPKSKGQYLKLLAKAKKTNAGALLVKEFNSEIPCTQIVVEDPLKGIMFLLPLFYAEDREEAVVDSSARIHETAKLGENVGVGPYAVIGADVHIGNNTIIHPHVVIYRGARIGSNVTIHAGAVVREYCVISDHCVIQNGVVIGGDGFGYIPDPKVGHRAIPHMGNVVLEERVDVGANTAIDRAMLGQTRIGKSTKIDNLVQVGHNVQVGARSLLCGQVGISGSAELGEECVLGGQVGVRDHVILGNRVRAAGLTGIWGDVEDGTDLAGNPEVPFADWLRVNYLMKKLPQMAKQLRKLSKIVESNSK